jgi:hypothetical protein
MQRSGAGSRVKVSADGAGVVSHAGVGLLRELARTPVLSDDTPQLARCEIHAFRHRVLHVAARLTRSARRLHLRLDRTWRWATAIAAAFHRLRAAFT